MLRATEAREHLIPFTKFTMLHPEDDGSAERSRYVDAAVHRVIAEQLELVESGKCLRMCLSIPPQTGKSELASRRLIPWFLGRNPHKHVMFGTYSQDFAEKFGGQVREIMLSEAYRQVFDTTLKQGSKSKSEMETNAGGQVAFLGRKGSGSGRPADLFVIDDPIKDAKEAESPTIREDVWEFFTKVVYTRLHMLSAVCVIHTRWHEDDLIGRLTDPTNPHWDAEIAKQWTYINIPAIVDDPKLAKALDLPTGSPLWPARFSLDHLESARRMNPRGFSALYMGKPSPDDGTYFKSDMIVDYRPDDLPKKLRMFAASDHALTEKEENDATCMGAFGMDENDHIWIMPDLFWERVETDRTVEEMIALMKRHKPQIWWAEDEHIKKSIGPFLRARQKAERIYTNVMPITPNRDLRSRARSIQGRMSMKMVHFPKFAPWYTKARHEMLKFPAATHDDFVSFLAQIGMGLDYEFGAAREAAPDTSNVIKVGSMKWVKAASAREQQAADYKRAMGGM